MGLCLTLRLGEMIKIGDDIFVSFKNRRKKPIKNIRIYVGAPKGLKIDRIVDESYSPPKEKIYKPKPVKRPPRRKGNPKPVK